MSLSNLVGSNEWAAWRAGEVPEDEPEDDDDYQHELRCSRIERELENKKPNSEEEK